MKNLSQIDGYLNESLKIGNIKSSNNKAEIDIKDDNNGGYLIRISATGIVKKKNIPENAEILLKDELDEIATNLGELFPWLEFRILPKYP